MANSRYEGRHSTLVQVGIVVPTLGTRPDYLRECVTSIRAAGNAHVTLVRPPTATIAPEVLDIIDMIVDDPGIGLAAAINTGIRALPETIRFASWLGDDDRLVPDTLPRVVNEFNRTGAAAVFGQCRYIDAEGRLLWLNKSGRWASPLMLVGPQLVPQPGSLFSRGDFEAFGGLDEARKWAFDLEMFLQLRRRPGGLRYLSTPLAEFRWHEGSLSVGGRLGSVTESSDIRRRHLKPPLRQLSALWEPALRRLILWAGERMNRRLSASR